MSQNYFCCKKHLLRPVIVGYRILELFRFEVLHVATGEASASLGWADMTGHLLVSSPLTSHQHIMCMCIISVLYYPQSSPRCDPSPPMLSL